MKFKLFLIAVFVSFSSTLFAQNWSLFSTILTSQDISSNQLSWRCKEGLLKFGFKVDGECRLNGNEWQIVCDHKSADETIEIAWCDIDTYPLNVSIYFMVSLDYAYYVDSFAQSISKEDFSVDYHYPNNKWHYDFKAKPNGKFGKYRQCSGYTSSKKIGNKEYFVMYMKLKD